MNHEKHGTHAMNHDDHGKKHGRHQGMIMTMFRHDHATTIAWQLCFSNSGMHQLGAKILVSREGVITILCQRILSHSTKKLRGGPFDF